MRDVLRGVRAVQCDKADPYIVQQLAFATYKSNDPDAKTALLESKAILSQLDPETSSDPETLGLWGAIHKRPHGDLVELDIAEGADAYSSANDVVIDEARKLAGVNDHGQSRGSLSLIALVVWEGASRGADDNTNKFVELARHSGFQLEQVLTLDAARKQ